MSIQKKILIIEDNPGISTALSEVLSDIGYLVETATNGKEGLDYLISHKILPDLILLDIFLPLMGGVEFRNRQLQIPFLSRIPVIAMSADSCVKQRSRICHISQFLKKPFELSDLIENIDVAFHRKNGDLNS